VLVSVAWTQTSGVCGGKKKKKEHGCVVLVWKRTSDVEEHASGGVGKRNDRTGKEGRVSPWWPAHAKESHALVWEKNACWRERWCHPSKDTT